MIYVAVRVYELICREALIRDEVAELLLFARVAAAWVYDGAAHLLVPEQVGIFLKRTKGEFLDLEHGCKEMHFFQLVESTVVHTDRRLYSRVYDIALPWQTGRFASICYDICPIFMLRGDD